MAPVTSGRLKTLMITCGPLGQTIEIIETVAHRILIFRSTIIDAQISIEREKNKYIYICSSKPVP